MRVVHKVKGLKYIQQHFALPFRVIFLTMKVIFTVAYTIYLIYITNKALISFLKDLILQGLRETAAQFRRQSQSLRQVRNFLYHIIYFILFYFNGGSVRSVGKACDCRAGGRRFDSCGRTNTTTYVLQAARYSRGSDDHVNGGPVSRKRRKK